MYVLTYYSHIDSWYIHKLNVHLADYYVIPSGLFVRWRLLALHVLPI